MKKRKENKKEVDGANYNKDDGLTWGCCLNFWGVKEKRKIYKGGLLCICGGLE